MLRTPLLIFISLMSEIAWIFITSVGRCSSLINIFILIEVFLVCFQIVWPNNSSVSFIISTHLITPSLHPSIPRPPLLLTFLTCLTSLNNSKNIPRYMHVYIILKLIIMIKHIKTYKYLIYKIMSNINLMINIILTNREVQPSRMMYKFSYVWYKFWEYINSGLL